MGFPAMNIADMREMRTDYLRGRLGREDLMPYSPLATALGFTPLPPLYWPLLFLTLLCYLVLTQIVKMWLIRKTWL